MATPFLRAGQVTISAGNNPIEIIGIAKFLRDAQRKDKDFDKEMKKASRQVAASLILKAKDEAATATRSRQAIQVMRGMRARSIITPTVSLSHNSPFISKSNPNKNRKKPVTRGDVFFGAEFGGGARPRTQQFLRHRGRKGYFFWPTVRKEKDNIAKEYLDAIQRVLNTLKDSA
jgi:Holliday junction resolvase RusA-like endonuclease